MTRLTDAEASQLADDIAAEAVALYGPDGLHEAARVLAKSRYLAPLSRERACCHLRSEDEKEA